MFLELISKIALSESVKRYCAVHSKPLDGGNEPDRCSLWSTFFFLLIKKNNNNHVIIEVTVFKINTPRRHKYAPFWALHAVTVDCFATVFFPSTRRDVMAMWKKDVRHKMLTIRVSMTSKGYQR